MPVSQACWGQHRAEAGGEIRRCTVAQGPTGFRKLSGAWSPLFTAALLLPPRRFLLSSAFHPHPTFSHGGAGPGSRGLPVSALFSVAQPGPAWGPEDLARVQELGERCFSVLESLFFTSGFAAAFHRMEVVRPGFQLSGCHGWFPEAQDPLASRSSCSVASLLSLHRPCSPVLSRAESCSPLTSTPRRK